jgi:virginiamycin B lyase
VDDRDRVWFVETGPQHNRFVGFDAKALRVVSETPIAKSGALVVRHMSFDPSSGSIWFGTDANTIGRARLP